MPSTKSLAFVETKFFPLTKASLPITDLAIQRAYAVFEALVSYGKGPVALAAHLKRLRNSARLMGLKNAPSGAFVERKIKQGLTLVSGTVLIKIFLTGGDAHYLSQEGKPRLIILFLPFKIHPPRFRNIGAKLLTTKLSRTMPQAKSSDYFAAVLAHSEAKKRGYDEALFVDSRNNILEGTTFNFALIKNGSLIVPKAGVLKGITLEIVKKLARRLGIRVQERLVRYTELRRVQEAFITSTTREVMPVVRVDEIKIGSGKIGPLTQKLKEAYRNFVRNPAFSASWRIRTGRQPFDLPAGRRASFR